MRILFAEDTADLNRVVTAMLEHAGYDVDSVMDGEAAWQKLQENGYDAVILDIMMPKKDGLSVLRDMRSEHILVPVMMLTAKAEVDDRVEGLNLGADDYLPKPFSMKELLARVNAMTRRRSVYETELVTCGDFTLDSRTFAMQAENTVRLSIKEFELMQLLAQHVERELEEAFILEHIWEKDPQANADTVYLYVSYLRRKLRSVASDAVIEGDRGGWYRLVVSR